MWGHGQSEQKDGLFRQKKGRLPQIRKTPQKHICLCQRLFIRLIHNHVASRHRLEPSVGAIPIEAVVDNYSLAALRQRSDDISVREYHIILRAAYDDIALCGRHEPSLVVVVVSDTVDNNCRRTYREDLHVYFVCGSHWSVNHHISAHASSGEPYTVAVPVINTTQINSHASERQSGQYQIHWTMNQLEPEGWMLTIEVSVVDIEPNSVGVNEMMCTWMHG